MRDIREKGKDVIDWETSDIALADLDYGGHSRIPLKSDDFDPTQHDFQNAAPLLFTGPYVLGIDFSHWNSTADFKAIKAGGFEFVILKASELVGWYDPTFEARWKAALDAWMIVGTYHFFRGNYDGSDQANYHLEIIRPLLDATKGKVIPPGNDV